MYFCISRKLKILSSHNAFFFHTERIYLMNSKKKSLDLWPVFTSYNLVRKIALLFRHRIFQEALLVELLMNKTPSCWCREKRIIKATQSSPILSYFIFNLHKPRTKLTTFAVTGFSSSAGLLFLCFRYLPWITISPSSIALTDQRSARLKTCNYTWQHKQKRNTNVDLCPWPES
jgi:hypothetical protein